jgi:hypothetical protein
MSVTISDSLAGRRALVTGGSPDRSEQASGSRGPGIS